MNRTGYGIGALIVWSVSAVILAYTNPIPPFQLSALVFLIATMVLAVWHKSRGDLRKCFHIKLKSYALLLYGIGIYTVFLIYAFKNIHPFEANTLNYLWPILLTIFVSITHNIRPAWYQLTGLLLGFIGCVILFYGRTGGENIFENGVQTGHVIAIAAALVWASYSAATKFVDFRQSANLPVFLTISLICLVLHILFEETIWPETEWIFVVLMGISRLTYLFWDYAMKGENVELLSSFAYFVPLFSTLSLTFFGILPNNSTIVLSAFLIVSGCLMANYKLIRKHLVP